MAITELRDKLLAELHANPLDVTNVVAQLRASTGPGQVLEPANETDQFAVWNPILVSLLESGMVHQATEVGLAWYARLCELQAQHGHRFHKGSPTHQIANCFLTRGRPHSAHWYFALAFIEDVVPDSAPQSLRSCAGTSRTVPPSWSLIVRAFPR
jgi:hypothetical protein